jgi:glutathione S-transferase
MVASIELTKEYGYVVLVLVAYAMLNFWMSFQVGKARRKYKVFYPTMYAIESENKDAKLFNCVQVGLCAQDSAVQSSSNFLSIFLCA